MADISKITLPSGTTYDIKDAVARSAIAGGIGFVFAWTATDYANTTAPSASKLATIPVGVKVYYNNGASNATGTKTASADDLGKFYLIYSKTQVGDNDVYDEYVAADNGGTYIWERLGDTQIDLSNVVTNVTLNQQTTQFVTGYASPTTDTVIGSDATFSVTQPTISVTPSKKYLRASASGGGAAWNSKDQKTVLTSIGTASTKSAIGASSTFTVTQPTVTMTASPDDPVDLEGTITNSVTPSYAYIVPGTAIYGVQSSTTTASKATAATSQTTATGAGTSSSTNTDWLKGVSVSNETLTIGAATLNTQTTTQHTFSDVTVPKKNTSTTNFLASIGTTQPSQGSYTTVVTGVTANNFIPIFTASGGNVAWNSKDAVTAVTGYSSPGTATVIGSSSTFTNSQPTVTLATNDTLGDVQVVTGISSATATGGNVAWNSKDQVTALTGLGTASKSAGLNTSTSLTVTKGA